MRIHRSQDTGSRTLWQSSGQWLRSRGGLAQFFLTMALGIALAVLGGSLYKRYGAEIVEPRLQALFAEAKDTAETALPTNDLPNLYLDIGFEEYQAMATQREEALQEGILLLDDDDWMRAQIRFQGETIPIRVRLKGDWVDHLGENKWSFRVKTRSNAVLMGMRSFSLQSPHTRGFLNEWLYLEALRRVDVLAPRYAFVNLAVNGDDWGIYALEESFAKELFESQGRREGVIVRFDESLLWRHRALFGSEAGQYQLIDPVASTFESVSCAEADEFNTNRVQADPVLREESTTALGLLRGFQSKQLAPSQVFDAELTGRYMAHTNLWGARHGLCWHNERYYYNPLTVRLEPIGYDTFPFLQPYARFYDLAQYEDLPIMEAYSREVARISQAGYLEELQAAYAKEHDRYSSALAQEFDPYYLKAPWDILAERQAMLRNSLHPPQTVYAYQTEQSSEAGLTVQVANVLRYPVVLQGVQIDDQMAAIQADWIAENSRGLLHSEADPQVVLRRIQGAAPKYVILHIPADVIDDLLPKSTSFYSTTLQIVTNLYGVGDQVAVDVRRDYPSVPTAPVLPVQPTVEEALARYPFLAPSEQPGFLELREGTWQVTGDLILPDKVGLWGTESTHLLFDRGALFFSNAPLLLNGSKAGEIVLGPKEDHWAGLIVLQAGTDLASSLQNVEIRRTAGIAREGWITTGGVTFYESPVVLNHCRLLDSVAEDAINVLRAKFQFTDTEFGNIASDAFDGDFVQGRIEDCAFHDIRGDAIDVSGSNITLERVRLLRVHDKGISAGEGSIVKASDVRAVNVGMAIASKDMSQVIADNVHIARAWVAGLAAYLKKMEYGPATIQASNVVFGDNSPQSLVQTGSSVSINGKAAKTTDLDIAGLYEELEALARIQVLDYYLGPAIRLIGYELHTPEIKPGEEISLTLYWQADARPEHDYKIFVHILDASGAIVAQHDNMPKNNSLPTTHWQDGSRIDDVHRIPLAPDLPAGEYRVALGMYLYSTGERLPVYRPNASMIPDGAIVLAQTVHVSK